MIITFFYQDFRSKWQNTCRCESKSQFVQTLTVWRTFNVLDYTAIILLECRTIGDSSCNHFLISRWGWGDIRRDNPESQICQCWEDWGDWILWRLTHGGVCRSLLASAHGEGTWGEWGTRSRIPVIFYCLKKCKCDEDLQWGIAKCAWGVTFRAFIYMDWSVKGQQAMFLSLFQESILKNNSNSASLIKYCVEMFHSIFKLSNHENWQQSASFSLVAIVTYNVRKKYY